jgi:outer membrane cobalamin receptor
MKKFLLILTLVLSASMAFAQTEQITVTANRIPESTNTVGAAVTVIKPTEDVVSALAKVPGLIAKSSGGEVTLSDATGTKLTYLLDGVPINPPDMSEPDLHGINWRIVDRIEVYSNSVWWGGTGTVINIITKKAEGKLGGIISGSVDNRLGNAQDVQVLAGPVRIDASNTTNKSQRAQSDSNAQSASVRADLPVAGQALVLQYFLNRHNFDLPGSLTEAQFEADPDQVGAYGSKDNTQVENLGRVSLTGKAFAGDYDLSGSLLSRSVKIYANTELLQGVAGAHEKWIIPLSAADYVAFQAGADFDKSATTCKSTVDRTILAVGASLTWSWSEDTLIATVVIRPQFFSMGAIKDNSIPASGSLIWNLGFLHTKATVAQTVRNPAVDEAFDLYSFPGFLENPNLAPEKDTLIDTSVEMDLGPLTVKVNPSVTWASGEITPVYDTNWNMQNINSDGITTRTAVKGEVDYTILPGVVASAGYTFAHAVDKDGQDLRGNATHTGRLALDTEFGGVDFSTSSGYEAESDGTKVEGQNLLNAYVQYTFKEGVKLRLDGKNLLNDRTPTYMYSNNGWYPSEGRTISLSASWSF